VAASPRRTDRPYLLTCALLLVIAFLYFARSVLIPVALAVMFAFVLSPLVTRLERRGLGRATSVLLVVLLVFLSLGGLGYVLSQQLAGLALRMEAYQTEIVRKIEGLRGLGDGGVLGRAQRFVKDISEHVVEQGKPGPQAAAEDTRPGATPDHPLYVSTAPSNLSRFLQVAGPATEVLIQFALVVVLVIFMLLQRENLRNRLVRLAGPGRLVLTTRAFDEGAHRLSRYLSALVLVNVGFGLTVAAGLFLLGACTGQEALYRYALLWGLICGAFRFIPYLGTWVGAALLFAFSVAVLPNWWMPLSIFAYFCAAEFLAANAVEPVVFGHSTGSSPLALLIATAFWGWLWGPLGLLLATPLTVTLVLLGKYVEPLHFFEVLLGDEPGLGPQATYYQRLLARDQDEASDVAEEHAEEHGTEGLYRDVFLPALSLARRDRARGDLDADQFDFVLQSTREVIEDLPVTPAEGGAKAGAEGPKAVFLGCPALDEADELSLRMFERALAPQGYAMELLSSQLLTAEVLARVRGDGPAVVCVGSLSPGGLARARYLCKRLRAQCPQARLVVGRWNEQDDLERVRKRLRDAGADHVATTFEEARAQLIPLLQVAASSAPRPARGDGQVGHGREALQAGPAR
jgi:predicted PurR-regulated permease PerM